MSDSKKPVAKVTLHPVSAAIWRNPSQNGDATFYSVSFTRSYRDATGNWKSTDSFNPGDLLLVAKAADLAESKIRELKNADRQQPEEEAA